MEASNIRRWCGEDGSAGRIGGDREQKHTRTCSAIDPEEPAAGARVECVDLEEMER